MRIDYTNKLTGMERFGCLVLFFFEDKLSPPAERLGSGKRSSRHNAALRVKIPDPLQRSTWPHGCAIFCREAVGNRRIEFHLPERHRLARYHDAQCVGVPQLAILDV